MIISCPDYSHSVLSDHSALLGLFAYITQSVSLESRSLCYCSVTKSCSTLCEPMTYTHQASLFFTTSWSLLKFMSVESMVPSNHFILCRPLLLSSIFPSFRVFSSELARHIRRPNYWNFSVSIHPSHEYSGLISFRID